MRRIAGATQNGVRWMVPPSTLAEWNIRTEIDTVQAALHRRLERAIVDAQAYQRASLRALHQDGAITFRIA